MQSRRCSDMLNDLCPLGECGIEKEAIVFMEAHSIHSDFVFQIFIKMPDGSTLALDVMSSYNIKVVKNLIKNATRIPRCEQRIWLSDNLLEDHIALQNHGIQKEASLTLSLRLTGGGKRARGQQKMK